MANEKVENANQQALEEFKRQYPLTGERASNTSTTPKEEPIAEKPHIDHSDVKLSTKPGMASSTGAATAMSSHIVNNSSNRHGIEGLDMSISSGHKPVSNLGSENPGPGPVFTGDSTTPKADGDKATIHKEPPTPKPSAGTALPSGDSSADNHVATNSENMVKPKSGPVTDNQPASSGPIAPSAPIDAWTAGKTKANAYVTNPTMRPKSPASSVPPTDSAPSLPIPIHPRLANPPPPAGPRKGPASQKPQPPSRQQGKQKPKMVLPDFLQDYVAGDAITAQYGGIASDNSSGSRKGGAAP